MPYVAPVSTPPPTIPPTTGTAFARRMTPRFVPYFTITWPPSLLLMAVITWIGILSILTLQVVPSQMSHRCCEACLNDEGRAQVCRQAGR